ncbi:MAG: hypothetical protein ACI8WB_003567, partial [Phenylobacterium sp.]
MAKNNILQTIKKAFSGQNVQAKALIAACKKNQDPYLDLGNCGITDLHDLPELFECRHLETLILSNRWIHIEKFNWTNSQNEGKNNRLTSIPKKISQLNHLHTLIISGNLTAGFTDNWLISDVGALVKLTNLKYLDISFNPKLHTKPLAQLTKLDSLILIANKISDIQFLENLASLHTLLLFDNQISNIQPLANLTKLRTLNLISNEISKTP